MKIQAFHVSQKMVESFFLYAEIVIIVLYSFVLGALICSMLLFKIWHNMDNFALACHFFNMPEALKKKYK